MQYKVGFPVLWFKIEWITQDQAAGNHRNFKDKGKVSSYQKNLWPWLLMSRGC